MDADQRRASWGLGDAVAGFFVGLVLSSLLASAWLALNPGDEDLSLGGQAFAQVGLWIGLAGSAVLAARRKGSGSLAEDFGFTFRPIDLLIGLAAGIAAQVVLVPVIALLLEPLLGEPDVSGPVQDLVDSATGLAIVGLVLFVAVGAPIVEELFFRGLVLRALLRRAGPGWSIALSSVAFGLAHPQDLSPEGLALVMTSLAALGAVMGLLAVRTGRLGPAVVTHAVFNGWTLAFVLAG